MLLCLDVGNTHILGGVLKHGDVVARFRYATHLLGTADQFGIFLINFLQVHAIATAEITAVSVSSVVPSSDYTLRHAISLYFKANYFVLQGGVKTGLNILCKSPKEVGADKIAGVMGAVKLFPQQNLIVIDMGTATTVCAVTKKRDYLGGTILPGLRLSMESLRNNTAKLMEVDIVEPQAYIARATRESIQSGLYYGHLGALKEMITGFKQEAFLDEPILVVGTGGFSQLYKDKKLFDVLLPDLVLQGLSVAYDLNHSS